MTKPKGPANKTRPTPMSKIIRRNAERTMNEWKQKDPKDYALFKSMFTFKSLLTTDDNDPA